MLSQRRFGKRLELPPTVQLVRELRMFCALEDARRRYAAANALPGSASWDKIAAAVSSRPAESHQNEDNLHEIGVNDDARTL